MSFISVPPLQGISLRLRKFYEFLAEQSNEVARGQQSYTPTIGATGGSVVTNSVDEAKYWFVNDLCFFAVEANVTTSSAPSRLTVTLPLTAVSSPNYLLHGGIASGIVGGNGLIGYAFTQGASAFLYRYDLAALGNGTGTIRVQGHYELA